MYKLSESTSWERVQATLKRSGEKIVTVQANIVRLVWEQIEPQKEEGKDMSFMYDKDRPTETYVVYILNRIVLDALASLHNKPLYWLHMHENVNTDGFVICWPQKIDTAEDAKMVLKSWLELLGALFASEAGDINHFFNPYSPHYLKDTIIRQQNKIVVLMRKISWKRASRKSF